MTKPRRSRNGADASDLIAALVSNIGALHNQVSRFSKGVHRLYGRIETTHRTADCFIAKSPARAPKFGFFDRKIAYVVANRVSPSRPADN